jgi:hypothetical protein
MSTPNHRATESELKSISPSVGRTERLSKLTGDYRAPSLANIVNEDRISHRELKRREAQHEQR